MSTQRPQIADFAQALLEADLVARKRGDRFGLCDQLSERGDPYPSQWLADLLDEARKISATSPDLETRTAASRWSTAHQWPTKA